MNKPHGIRGEIFTWPLTDHGEETYVPGARLHLGDADGRLTSVPARLLEVETVRPYRGGFLVKFAGVEDRTQAETLRNHYLLRPFADVAPPDADEFFYHELLGLRVRTVAGAHVGVVREVFELNPHHMVEVEREDGDSLLVPLARAVVHSVSVADGLLVIDPPPGLLDL